MREWNFDSSSPSASEQAAKSASSFSSAVFSETNLAIFQSLLEKFVSLYLSLVYLAVIAGTDANYERHAHCVGTIFRYHLDWVYVVAQGFRDFAIFGVPDQSVQIDRPEWHLA